MALNLIARLAALRNDMEYVRNLQQNQNKLNPFQTCIIMLCTAREAQYMLQFSLVSPYNRVIYLFMVYLMML